MGILFEKKRYIFVHFYTYHNHSFYISLHYLYAFTVVGAFIQVKCFWSTLYMCSILNLHQLSYMSFAKHVLNIFTYLWLCVKVAPLKLSLSERKRVGNEIGWLYITIWQSVYVISCWSTQDSHLCGKFWRSAYTLMRWKTHPYIFNVVYKMYEMFVDFFYLICILTEENTEENC